jgi:hypothetical protein
MAENRLNRNLDTRDKTERTKKWQRASTLPDPDPRDGWGHRWVRLSMMGTSDPGNLSRKLREGWEPVVAKDYPEIQQLLIENEKFKDNIVMGGLMLCRAPIEMLEDRASQIEHTTKQEMESANNHFMSQNDPRMPLFNESRTTRGKMTFGPGN